MKVGESVITIKHKEEMDRSVTSMEAIYHDFILERKDKNNKDKLFCFYEGKTDFAYYDHRVTLLSRRKTKAYDCEGKKIVLNLYKKILSSTKDGTFNSLFFIDNDFDEVISNERVYAPPCYSVENLYILGDAIEKIIQGVFNLNQYKDEINRTDYFSAITYINNMKKDFFDQIILLNAWYSLQKKKSININYKEKPNLAKLKQIKTINMVIKFKLITSNYCIDFLKSNTPNYVEVTSDELEQELKRLAICPDSNIRGKYISEFLVKVIDHLIAEANKPCSLFKSKHTTKFNFNVDSILSDLSQYAETPDCLRAFLESVV